MTGVLDTGTVTQITEFRRTVLWIRTYFLYMDTYPDPDPALSQYTDLDLGEPIITDPTESGS